MAGFDLRQRPNPKRPGGAVVLKDIVRVRSQQGAGKAKQSLVVAGSGIREVRTPFSTSFSTPFSTYDRIPHSIHSGADTASDMLTEISAP